MSDTDPLGSQPSEDEEARLSSSSRTLQDTSMDDLTQRFSQQQIMISQLKEMALAEEAARTQKIASTRLKMEKCASQLARIRDRAKLTKLKNSPGSTSEKKVQSDSAGSDAGSKDVLVSSPEVDRVPPQGLLAETSLTPSAVASPALLDISENQDLRPKSKTPSREVTKMLYQQIKEHKAMIAERTRNEKELEQALAKIQKQLEATQSESAELLQLGQIKSKSEIAINLDEKLESNKLVLELQNRIKHLEGNILDLQETCKEKDSVIDSKTKAITLMSADLSKKGKNTQDLLDETKQEMQEMQRNFAAMESKIKSESQDILNELEVSRNRVTYLEEANSILESERFKLSVENSNLEERLNEKNTEINKLNDDLIEKIKTIDELNVKIQNIDYTDLKQEEKGIAEIKEMESLSEKIEILEKLNLVLRQSNIELQEKLSPTASPEKELPLSPKKQVKEDSPKPQRKGNKSKGKGGQKPKPQDIPKATEDKDSSNELTKTIQRLEVTIQSLNNQVLDKEVLLLKMENENELLKKAMEETPKQIETLETTEEVTKTVETPLEEAVVVTKEEVDSADVRGEDNRSLEERLQDALKQIEALSKELADANKNMIKMKATAKAKVKQMQKSIDDFSKVSNINSEVVKLQSEIGQLTQKVAELEEEKGNLQLHLVDYDSGRVSDSQLHAKLMEIEVLAEERLKAIADLETQKFDLVQELHLVKQQISTLEDKVADLTFFENEHVSAEMKSVQLEEQLDLLKVENKNLIQEIASLKNDVNELQGNIEALMKDKTELNTKLEFYVHENMELIDRLDKMSTEKVSSAESIEMVESLTTQEKMEIEQYQKKFDPEQSIEKPHLDTSETEETKQSGENIDKLKVEITELVSKIELFTQERHEVMEKLDNLRSENATLSAKLEELLEEKEKLTEEYKVIKRDKYELESENVALSSKLQEASQQRDKLSQNVDEVSEKIDQLKKEAENMKQVEHNLKTDNDELSSKIQEISGERDELKQDLDVMKQTKDDLILSIQSESNSQSAISELNNTIETLKTENNSLSEKVQQLMEQKQITTEENVISETVEVTDAVEKQIIQGSSSELKSPPSVPIKEVKEQNVAEPKQAAVQSEKSSGAKNTKNLTKEILRLKNVVKDQETEIHNLSQKISEIQNAKLENDVAKIMEEKHNLSDELSNVKEEKNLINEKLVALQEHNNELMEELKTVTEHKVQTEELLREAERQLMLRNESIQGLSTSVEEQNARINSLNEIISKKDTEISACFIQIDQLNSVSLKLKSTLTQYEEDKSANLQNNEIIKGLNNNINALQNIINQNEAKIQELENSNCSLEAKVVELNKILQDKTNETSVLISKLQSECSSKDEEIHEIKLQLRKESIEYDKMKNSMSDIENAKEALQNEMQKLQEKCSIYEEQESKYKDDYSTLDNKYKEQYEKLKKFAVNFKKKATVCAELEGKIAELNNELQQQLKKKEEAEFAVQTLQQELAVVKSEHDKIQSEIHQSTSSHQTVEALQYQIFELHLQMENIVMEHNNLKINFEKNLSLMSNLTAQNDQFKSLIADYELQTQSLSNDKSLCDQKLMELDKILNEERSKFLQLEEMLTLKQTEIEKHNEALEQAESQYNQYKCGHEIKMQEKDVYIESLEMELLKQKDRISRLEDSVSTMEERRSSLERKADCLVNKLQEKDKIHSETSLHEDELEKRLAALIAHDEVIQKQLQTIQSENAELLKKSRHLGEAKKELQNELDISRASVASLKNDLEQLQVVNEERIQTNDRISSLENELKRVNIEYTEMTKAKAAEYEYLENEFHSHISNTESQRRMSKEQLDRLQDEMVSNTQNLKELQTENDWLRSEVETITQQKLYYENLNNELTMFQKHPDANVELENLRKELAERTNELEVQRNQLTAMLQNQTPEQEKKQIQELQNTLLQKDQEILTLNNQFQSCLSQLTEVVEAEKHLKTSHSQLNDSLQDKEKVIKDLRNEILQLSGQMASTSSGNVQWDDLLLPRQEIPVETCIQQLPFYQMMAPPKLSQTNTMNALDVFDLKSIEDQIVSSEVTDDQKVSDLESRMIRAFQHDPAERVPQNVAVISDGSTPVVEGVITPRTAYECFDEETQPPVASGEEEGWGWGGQEAQLEEEYMQTQVSKTTAMANEFVINELQAKILELTDERDKLQEKAMKALKKLKEFKQKNDALTNELKNATSSSEVNMLDAAIQDELASQVKNLEEKMKELMTDAKKEKMEKNNLQKRIDVLISANERFTEMKEKQDIEMEAWKLKTRQLSDKLKNLEWDTNDAENDAPKKEEDGEKSVEVVNAPVDQSLPKIVEELNDKIKELEADNEELQAMLEEQQLRFNSPKVDEKLVAELEEIRNQSIKIQQDLTIAHTENNELKTKVAELTQESEENSKSANNSMLDENNDLKTKLEALIKEYYEFQEKYNETATEKDRIELQYSSVLKDKQDLEIQNTEITALESACKAELIKMEYEKEEIADKYEDILRKMAELKDKSNSESSISMADQMNRLTQELDEKSQQIESISAENITLHSNVAKLNEENGDLLSNLAELRNSVTDAVDQRGTEIAEMWKQHLAMREAEFENLEQCLRQEINDLHVQLSHLAQSVSPDSHDSERVEAKMVHAVETIPGDVNNSAQVKLEELTSKYQHLYEVELPSIVQKYESLLQQHETQGEYVKQKEEELASLHTEFKSVIEQLEIYKSSLQEMEINFSVKVSEFNNIVLLKDSELNSKAEEINQLKGQLSTTETKMADLVHENEAELANMRLKSHAERTSLETSLTELKATIKSLEMQLDAKIDECRKLTSNLSSEDLPQIAELRTALENQELEIVTLKETIAAQGEAYEMVIQSQLKEKARLKRERHVSFSEDTKAGADVVTEEKPVTQRADLDLALYMLHQRDVRCEELTQELMQLLGERDTLQLKLSNAIRANEELRAKRSPSQSLELPADPIEPIAGSSSSFLQEEAKASAATAPVSNPETSGEMSPIDVKSLETKLTQLHTVGHARDVRLRDEREERQREMELLQRDVKDLPPEAAAKLREAHYTLTRDTQSASTVLLNWLWGKTTPKVVHM